MIRLHPSLTTFPAVITKQRPGGSWIAYLEGLAHRAFADGGSEQAAVDNLARAVELNREAVTRSAVILGLERQVAA